MVSVGGFTNGLCQIHGPLTKTIKQKDGGKMGLLKTHIQDFLETIGYELGYSMNNLPLDVREVNKLMKKYKNDEDRRQTS